MTPHWEPLIEADGKLSGTLKKKASVASGAYAVRDKRTGGVVYVGESSTGNLWKTLLRHFQAPSSFRDVREIVFLGDHRHFEIALWVTSRGHRPLPPLPNRKESKRIRDLKKRGEPYTLDSDAKALEAQAEWIARFEGEGHELLNQDDGRAELEDDAQGGDEGDDSFAFGANPPPLGPNVAAEKLAANRTPDLFTGRTKLEEGGKGQRRDWKGDAERAARELAECRRASATPVHAEAPAPVVLPPTPPPRPEGYGVTDEKGQATMFKRNPKPLVTAAKLKLLASGTLDTREHREQTLKVLEAADRASAKEVRETGDRAVADERNHAARGAVLEAAAAGDEARRARLTGAVSTQRRAARDAQPVPGTYEHELAVARAQRNNPSVVVGKLTELGVLTELVFAKVDTRKAIVVVLAWSLRDAPVLAYDTRGRLFIVYAGKVARPSSRAELQEYARTHWGAKGRGDVRHGGRAVGPFRTLGLGTSIQYTTKKGGDRKLVNYVHEWGEGGPKAFTPPAIVEHDCKRCGPRCGARGALALSGGSYVVNDRGIVG